MVVCLLDYFLTQYLPVYPYPEEGFPSWEETVDYMKNSPSDWVTVGQLSEDYINGTGFRVPVRVGVADCNGSEYQAVLDGTHRVVTMILSGAEVIEYVEDEEESETPASTGDDENVCLTVQLEFDPEGEDNDLSDYFFDWLRSIRLNDEVWLTSDLAVGQVERTQFFYWGDGLTGDDLVLLEQKVSQLVEASPYSDRVMSLNVFFDVGDLDW